MTKLNLNKETLRSLEQNEALKAVGASVAIGCGPTVVKCPSVWYYTCHNTCRTSDCF
jgi:hypothetical protein